MSINNTVYGTFIMNAKCFHSKSQALNSWVTAVFSLAAFPSITQFPVRSASVLSLANTRRKGMRTCFNMTPEKLGKG